MEDLTDISLRRRIYEFLKVIDAYDINHDFLSHEDYLELIELQKLLTSPSE